MAVVHVRVMSALSGEELLAETSVLGADLVRHVREVVVRPRPSTGLTLLHAGALFPDDFQVAPDDVWRISPGTSKWHPLIHAGDLVELTALFGGDALTVEERKDLIAQLHGCAGWTSSVTFGHFSAAAKDDKAVVLAAVHRHGPSLFYASEHCKNDKEIVMAAVRNWGCSLRHAGAACRDDREIVLEAVRQNGMVLECASESCRDDREIVMAAVCNNGASLRYAGDVCRDDPEILLAAVNHNRGNPFKSFQRGGEICMADQELAMAVAQHGSASTTQSTSTPSPGRGQAPLASSNGRDPAIRVPSGAARESARTTSGGLGASAVTPGLGFDCPEPKVAKDALPEVWVTRWVDYTSRYGVVYQLPDGSVGVYFNDATKALCAPDGSCFEYIPRSTAETQSMRSKYTFDDYPADLRKKATLLNYFRLSIGTGALNKNGATAGESSLPADKRMRIPKLGSSEVYVRKWCRRSSAIMFSLSNTDIQVVFSDATEVFVSFKGQMVTYRDKHGSLRSMALSEALVSGGDLVRRLRYILSNMLEVKREDLPASLQSDSH